MVAVAALNVLRGRWPTLELVTPLAFVAATVGGAMTYAGVSGVGSLSPLGVAAAFTLVLWLAIALHNRCLVRRG